MEKNLGSLLMLSKECQSPKMYDEIKEILQLIGSCCYYGSISEDKCEKYCDYITNLREENEHLRTQLNTLENTVIEVNKECNRLFNHLTKKDLDYKSRNKKAIECIKNKVGNEIHDMMYVIDVSDVLDILQGEDKE